MISTSTRGQLVRIAVVLGAVLVALAAAVAGVFGADRWARSERAARFSARLRRLGRGSPRPQSR